MPTFKIKQFRGRQFGGAAPYGNAATLAFGLKTVANGAPVNADLATPIAAGDKVVLGYLPAGFRLDDMQMVISVGMSATVTASLGFEYEDGIDVPAVPQSAAYFGAGLVVSAAARLRMATTSAPVTLPKNAVLILTTAVAANAKVSVIDITVTGELTGPK